MTEQVKQKTFKAKNLIPILCGEQETPLFKRVLESAWDDEGKYQCQKIVFKELATGLMYYKQIQRHGSYFSDYYFDFQDWKPNDDIEVHEAELTIILTHELQKPDNYYLLYSIVEQLIEGEADMLWSAYNDAYQHVVSKLQDE